MNLNLTLHAYTKGHNVIHVHKKLHNKRSTFNFGTKPKNCSLYQEDKMLCWKHWELRPLISFGTSWPMRLDVRATTLRLRQWQRQQQLMLFFIIPECISLKRNQNHNWKSSSKSLRSKSFRNFKLHEIFFELIFVDTFIYTIFQLFQALTFELETVILQF